MKNIADVVLAGRNIIRVISLIIMVTTFLVLGTIGTIWASIEESPHNPSPDNCHICHMQRSEQGQAPSWLKESKTVTFSAYNRDKEQEPRTITPNMAYNSPTHDMGNTKSLNTQSYFCLACHNGVHSKLVKVGYSFLPDSELSEISDYEIDLTGDHPVGFAYNPYKDSDDNHFPVAVEDPQHPGSKIIYGKITGAKYPLYGMNGNNFECTTCHIAHYSEQDNKSDYQVKLLRADNSRSSMCRDCHTNK
ncbi:MAG: hypothetical protein WC853_11120 [Thermodesulfovibrionales bacterium]